LFSLGISVINVLQGRGLRKEIKFREGRKSDFDLEKSN